MLRQEQERAWPRVSEIMREAGLCPDMGRNEYAMDRGTKAHLATELDDLGDLDEETLAPELRGYVDAWRKFRRETGWTVLHIEKRVVHENLRYRGTLDRIMQCAEQTILLDIKTGTPAAFHSIQTALYTLAWAEAQGVSPLMIRRASTCLADDGTYKVSPHTDRQDFAVAEAAVTLYHWRKRHGLL